MKIWNLTDSKIVTTEQITGAPLGFAGHLDLTIPILVDSNVTSMSVGIIGANEKDHHIRNIIPGRDFPMDHVADFRNVIEGDSCPKCKCELKFFRGIEVGHVFKLGTKYSEKLGAKYLDPSGREQVMIMGCYGIGVSRVLSAVVEQNNDLNGIIWPISIAPFHVLIIPVSVKDPEQMRLADQLYSRLCKAGIEVLLNDRDERPGVKFKDSVLIGIPIRIIVGKYANEGIVEFKERNSMEQKVMSNDAAFLQTLKIVKMNEKSSQEKICQMKLL